MWREKALKSRNFLMMKKKWSTSLATYIKGKMKDSKNYELSKIA